MYKIINANYDMLRTISYNLRQADKDEIMASSGSRCYLGALNDSMLLSEICKIWTVNDKPCMIFGCTSDGVIWAMGTDEMSSHKKYFLLEGKKFVNECIEKYGMIFNYVYAENSKHIHFLKKMGFTFSEDITKINDNDFIYFYKKNDNNNKECL